MQASNALAEQREAERLKAWNEEQERLRIEAAQRAEQERIEAARRREERKRKEAIQAAAAAEQRRVDEARRREEEAERRKTMSTRAQAQVSIGRLEASRRVREFNERQARRQAEYDRRIALADEAAIPFHMTIKQGIPDFPVLAPAQREPGQPYAPPVVRVIRSPPLRRGGSGGSGGGGGGGNGGGGSDSANGQASRQHAPHQAPLFRPSTRPRPASAPSAASTAGGAITSSRRLRSGGVAPRSRSPAAMSRLSSVTRLPVGMGNTYPHAAAVIESHRSQQAAQQASHRSASQQGGSHRSGPGSHRDGAVRRFGQIGAGAGVRGAGDHSGRDYRVKALEGRLGGRPRLRSLIEEHDEGLLVAAEEQEAREEGEGSSRKDDGPVPPPAGSEAEAKESTAQAPASGWQMSLW